MTEIIDIPETSSGFNTLIFSAGVLAGSIFGSLVTMYVKGKEFDKRLTEETEAIKAFYEFQLTELKDIPESADPEDILEDKYAETPIVEKTEQEIIASERMANEARTAYAGYFKSEEKSDPVKAAIENAEVKGSIKKSIFDGLEPITQEEDEFDLEREEELRAERPGHPFVLEHDEFFNNDPEHSQNSLTYFEGDDVLVDERDNPIADVAGMIGHDTLRFGYGSRDRNIVYIRNPRREVDFEITRSPGSFAKEVMGFDEDTYKKGKRPKFRDDD